MHYGLVSLSAFLVAQLVKNPPAMRKTWVQSLEKGMVPTSVFWPGESHGLYSPWATSISLHPCQQSYTELEIFFQLFIKRYELPGNFLGGPVAKTLHSQCRRLGFDPWRGIDPTCCDPQSSQKLKKKKKKKDMNF